MTTTETQARTAPVARHPDITLALVLKAPADGYTCETAVRLRAACALEQRRQEHVQAKRAFEYDTDRHERWIRTAIERARQKDYSEIDRLRQLLADPFAEQPEMDAYAAPPPDWGRQILVSCSS